MTPAEFLRERFRQYYSKRTIPAPSAVESREFGYGGFGEKIGTRHTAFASQEEFNNFLRATVPFYVSSSVAYYKFPARRPMEAKEFQGADIVYEFDANDLKPECSRNHDLWKCAKCGASGKGVVDACFSCGSPVAIDHWVCESCLGDVKREVVRLLEFIENDFGISDGIAINFSGNRGYHVHLQGESVRHLSKEARVEMLDYLTAFNIKPALLGFPDEEKKTGARRWQPDLNQGFKWAPLSKAQRGQAPGISVPQQSQFRFGWPRRVHERITELLKEGDAEKIAALGGISLKESKDLLNEADTIISGISAGHFHRPAGRKTAGFWNSLVGYSIQKLKLPVDRQTSLDISKLIRVPETLHGSTGLAAKKVEVGELKNFMPLEHAVVLGSAPVKVKAIRWPEFGLGGKKFSACENSETELPEFAAAYLVAKGAAVPA